MPDSGRQIGFEQPGIGSVIRTAWLQVPLHQRDYSWEAKHVRRLFQDVNRAVASGDPEYFLGSIVTIPREENVLEVVDGQQRLATTAILLAAIRDYLRPRKEDELVVQDIESTLSAVDIKARERKSRIRLNVTDNQYFQRRVLESNEKEPTKALSHRLIDEAAVLAKAHVGTIVAGHNPKNHGDILVSWITYLMEKVIVVLLKVPSEVNAYRMFETLNDRGLKTSQSDLVKNYLFGEAKDRLQEAQQKWSGARAILESFEDDDITINFLRQTLVSIYGYIGEKDVYDTVSTRTKGAAQSISFLDLLESYAADYAAVLNPEHEKWNSYPAAIRRSIQTLALVRMGAMRPLILAVARKFTPPEADKALRLIISVSVRISVAGGAKAAARSGAIEEALADYARRVTAAEVTTAAQLLGVLEEITPKDPQFQEAFGILRVAKAEVARYYLRSLEQTHKGAEEHPFYIPNEDPGAVNLEHVLPKKTEGNWPQFTEEEVEAYYRRVGNMVLLNTKLNSDLKSADFETKKAVYAKTPYEVTQQAARAEEWTKDVIHHRQQVLAEVASRTWPLRVT